MRPGTDGQGTGPRVVALGGGHGLAATLRALRRVTDRLTAVVGVADDGGSSGRLRREYGILPPGDLRMALAALCGDDSWGRTWSRVVQHRFSSPGSLDGHSVGNLLITALWEETGDVVAGLDWVAALLGAHGRVLPSTVVPLEIVAQIRAAEQEAQPGNHRGDAVDSVTIRGQSAVARSKGGILSLAIDPADPPATPEALAALASADAVVLGPGSWFTSVLPHLLIPDIADALRSTSALRILVLNLGPEAGETRGFAPETHLEVLARQFPGIRLDIVLADRSAVSDPRPLLQAADAVGAQVHLADLIETGSDGALRHDVDLLAAALGRCLSRGRIGAWR